MAGQSDPHVSLFSAEELEFMAEDELVEIVPNMRMEPLNLLCGDYGPFFPQMVTQVPVWLAIALKKRGKCSIRPPDWMSVESLTRILESERESQDVFQVLPFNYVEISKLLFDHKCQNMVGIRFIDASSNIVNDSAPGDIPDIYMVRSLIEDVRDVRFHKFETSLESFEAARSSAVRINNLSAMEVNIARPFVSRALQAFYKHTGPDLVPNPETVPNRWQQPADPGQKRTLRKR